MICLRHIMRLVLAMAIVVTATLMDVYAQSPGQGPNPDIQYRLGPDSLEQEGAPKGEIRGPFTLPSEVFPGTSHTYWVYVPGFSSIPAGVSISTSRPRVIGATGTRTGLPNTTRWTTDTPA